jgi:hypothetical protein
MKVMVGGCGRGGQNIAEGGGACIGGSGRDKEVESGQQGRKARRSIGRGDWGRAGVREGVRAQGLKVGTADESGK